MFHCKSCDFRTSDRKTIRHHVQEEHEFKGGKSSVREFKFTKETHRNPLSALYENR